MLRPTCFLMLVGVGLVSADGPGLIISRHADADFALTADPDAAPWKGVTGIFMDHGPKGEAVPEHRSEVRSRWTKDNVYFLFVCPYEALHLHPKPHPATETNGLWDWDVAEVFVGTDFEHISLYKEFEMSPQAEWVDLDINRDKPHFEKGWVWNSGFAVKARIDSSKKIWYGEMRIPIKSIDRRPPAPGIEMRINFYRCQGANPHRKYVAWQPTGAETFHVPEAFGRIKLE